MGLIVFSSRTIDKGRSYLEQREGEIRITQRIQMIRSLEGVTSSVVGMKNPEHVKENLKVFDLEKISSQDMLEEQLMALLQKG